MRMHSLAATGMAACVLLLPGLLGAQAAGERLAGGSYVAMVWNRGSCTVAVEGADRAVPAQREGLLLLPPSADAPAERRISLDGRAAATADARTHLQVYVNESCSIDHVERRSRAELIAGLETTVRSIEFRRQELRYGTYLDLIAAGFSAWGAARWLDRGTADGRLYGSLAVGATTAFTISAVRGFRRLRVGEDPRRLEVSRRALEVLRTDERLQP